MTAAIAGLILVYGATYALEGMTVRLPMSSVRELAIISLWAAPWMLLFCSGAEDIEVVARRQIVFWIGVIAALAFLYYFDQYTSMSLLTKAAMPPLAIAAGLAPHFIKQIQFLFSLSSLMAGAAGAYILYYLGNTIFSPTMHFASKFIGFVIVIFGLASSITGLLAIFDVYRRLVSHSRP
jgi:branched-subunit amino acid ABC-type transport system permease component